MPSDYTIGEIQKTFNTLAKLISNVGVIIIKISEGVNIDFLKKVTKFAGLNIKEDTDEVLVFSKKVYSKVIINQNVNSNGAVKSNPFAKAKQDSTQLNGNGVNKIDEES